MFSLVLLLIVIIEQIVLLDVLVSRHSFRDSAIRDSATGSKRLVLIDYYDFFNLFDNGTFLDLLQLLIISCVFQGVFLRIWSAGRVLSLHLFPLLLQFVLLNLLDLHKVVKLVVVVFGFDVSSCKITGFTLSDFLVETTREFLAH